MTDVSETPYRHLEVAETNDACILRFIDRQISTATATSELNDELIQIIETRLPRRLVCDLSRVDTCGTAVISSLLQARRRLQVYDGKLLLCGVQGALRDSFDMLGLGREIFSICDNWLEASGP